MKLVTHVNSKEDANTETMLSNHGMRKEMNLNKNRTSVVLGLCEHQNNYNFV